MPQEGTVMMNWDLRCEAVVQAAWKTWTNNGQNMNKETREETIRSVREAAINAWIDRMDDGAWVAATLGRLRHAYQLAQRGGGCVV
jgi:hypothetical protein